MVTVMLSINLAKSVFLYILQISKETTYCNVFKICLTKRKKLPAIIAKL